MKNSYLIHGKHASLAAIQNKNRNIVEILCSDNFFNEHENLISQRNFKITDPKKLNQLVENSPHQGIIVKTTPIAINDITKLDLSEPQCTIAILDQITDSHNIGAIIRSASAFGIHSVILTSKNSPDENGVIAKTASGGLEEVNLVKVINLQNTISYLKKEGFWIIGMDGDTKTNISQKILKGKTAIILGSEGTGMRQLTKKHCDIIAKIPMSPQMESLNVSSAAAIAFYQAFSLIK